MRSWACLGMAGLLLMAPRMAAGQEGTPENVREARIWLDRGDEAVVDRGDRLRVYYRTSHDSYVAIFHIDTDGSVNLVHPTEPGEDHHISGGRDYRLLFPRSPYWIVDEDPGVGYYFVLASSEPFDFSAFDYARYERGWNLSRVGRAVYDDPYLAMDDYVAALIPDWEYVPYALDFITYNVGGTHEYPRFMCYQCHGFRSYAQWNPYAYACTDFRVVIWDDPYFYPAYRYAGTRVVFATPLRGRARYGFTTRVAGQPWAPVVRRRAAPPTYSAQYKEAPGAQAPTAGPARRRAAPSAALRSPAEQLPARASVPAPGGVQRRAAGTAAPGGVSRGGTSGTARPSATSGGRPVLQRRPSSATRGGGGESSARPGLALPRTDGTPASGQARRPTGVRSPGATPMRTVGPTRGSVSAPTGRSGAGAAGGVIRRPTGPTRGAVRMPSRAPASGSSATVRPPARGNPQARPTVRPPAKTRPTVRPRTGGNGSSRGSARPPVRRRGGGGG